MMGSCLSIAAELFICPRAHQPWAADWSIPPNHLNNFEHSTISLFMLLYALLALAADATPHVHLPQGWLHSLAAIAFSQELLLFHFHSADHMGLEGHYHWLLQLPIATAILTLVTEVYVTTLPVLAIIRSMSILFQGTWFIQMGMVLWTPSLLPKGCVMVHTPDHDTVECTGDSTHIAKALANLQFSWHLAAIVVVTTAFMFLLSIVESPKYQHLSEEQSFKIVEQDDVEGSPHAAGSQHSMEMQPFDGFDLER